MIRVGEDVNTVFLSVTSAAKRACVSRRVIQLWLKAKKQGFAKDAYGRVCLGEVLKLRQSRTAGRPPKRSFLRMRTIGSDLYQKFVSVSAAARQACVSRRTIQNWLKLRKEGFEKDANGRVCLGDVIRLREGRTVGRPAKKQPNPEEGPYWGIAGTPDWRRASEYFGKQGSKKLRGMLACLAHDQIMKKKLHLLQNDLELALSLVTRMVQKKKDGEEWYALARRELTALRR